MKNKPFFSIVIPTLNEEKYISHLLTDLVAQTEIDFEVFIADGGSRDSTVRVIDKFYSKFPLTATATGSDVCSSRNTGTALAKGIYVLFLDADVRVNVEFLKLLKQRLSLKPVDFGTTRAVPDNLHMFDHSITYFTNLAMWIFNKLGKPFMGGQCLFLRRTVFKTLKGFDPQVIHAEDHELVQRARKQGFTGELFWTPVHRVSFRRFEREGRFKVICKWTASIFHTLVIGPIRKPLFDYPMGGDVKK